MSCQYCKGTPYRTNAFTGEVMKVSLVGSTIKKILSYKHWVFLSYKHWVFAAIVVSAICYFLSYIQALRLIAVGSLAVCAIAITFYIFTAGLARLGFYLLKWIDGMLSRSESSTRIFLSGQCVISYKSFNSLSEDDKFWCWTAPITIAAFFVLMYLFGKLTLFIISII